ncbi:MAG: carboxysome shell protein CsoS2 [uncultured Thiotrichaceae bacterium]|uniref:Carboxysome shell protein CsoS2 n=1 Tax=uncultured Thiotrichaceae bacterium TaxID=298394 RepID=A0A6S6TUV3_9GAMM|nr:MAG: carboxysome shell protein CsoS2 [uncultured Thiotrichaceae bacterium]
MPQNVTSADKKRMAQEARTRAALKKQSGGGRSRTRPARPNGSAAASASSDVTMTANAPANGAPSQDISAANTLSAEMLKGAVDQFETADENVADELCEMVVTNPAALGSLTPAIRRLCRNRRKVISSRGKVGVMKTRNASGTSSNAMLANALLDDDAGSRDFAKSRRSAISRMGRGNKPKSRPSRPQRPKVAPPKVEVGTTLSGGSVTGTQVERIENVTGNEQGICRSVTGTEYIGTEQFSNFCDTTPEKPTPKVGASLTVSGGAVSGTEIGRSVKMTGDEQGSCQAVTGSEYLGAERFADFCDNKGLTQPANKVVAGTSQKQGISITGADEARQNATTGMEIGADRPITGSQYTEVSKDLSSYSSGRSNLPSKMERPEAPGGSGVTGDEYSSYDEITGSDYSFNSPSFSYSRASSEAAQVPSKVGVDASCSGQRITGNLVDRSEKVTGNEHGSDRHLTGSQYGRNSCAQPSKVSSTHAFAGGRLTGNRVEHDPKINGDGISGCQPVTGTELHGLEQLADHCSSTQVPVSAGFDNTPPMVPPQPAVEPHAHDFAQAIPQQFVQPTVAHVQPQNAVPAAAPQGACCNQCAARQLAEQAGLLHGHQHPQAQPAMMQEPQAQHYVQQNVGMVTGPNNMGLGVVSGVPEAHYPQHAVQTTANVPVYQTQTAQFAQQHAYPNPNGQVQPVEQAHDPFSHRVTGEGRDDGLPITGDNWARGDQVTGTEGRWSQGRNPTLQVDSRMNVPGAHLNKGMDRPQAVEPIAPITGSSGNTESGAQVTVSGGARG